MIQLTLTLKMTTAQVVKTSVTGNNNSPIQDYVQPDDQTQPTFEMTPGFKPFTNNTIPVPFSSDVSLAGLVSPEDVSPSLTNEFCRLISPGRTSTEYLKKNQHYL